MNNKTNPFAPNLVRVVTAVVLAVAGGLAFSKVRGDDLGEYSVYDRAGKRFANHQTIYVEEPHAFTYPPFFVLVGAPYSLLDVKTGRTLWNMTNILLCVGSLAVLCYRLWPMGEASRRLFWIIAILSSTYLFSPIEYQGHDYWILLLTLLVFVFWDRRPLLAGVLAGLAAACKATPLLILPVLLVQKRFLPAGAMVLTMIGATLLPDLISPSDQNEPAAVTWYRRFIVQIEAGAPAHAQGGAWQSWSLHNRSLSGTLYRLTHPNPNPEQYTQWTADIPRWPDGVFRVCILALQFVITLVLLGTAYRMQRSITANRDFDMLGLGGMVLAAMALLSPMSNTPHFCMIVVPVSFLAYHWWYRRREWHVWLTLTIVLISGLMTAKDIVGGQIKTFGMIVGTHTWAALACFTSCALVLTRDFPSGQFSHQKKPD